MAKEIVSFWDQLEYFCFTDDKARWKAIGWIIFVTGSCGSIDLALLKSPLEDAIPLMGIIALLLSIGWLACYRLFRKVNSSQHKGLFQVRRRLLLQGVVSALGVVIAVLAGRRPARALNAELSQATETRNYTAVKSVLERAKTNRVRLDNMLLQKATQQVINTDSHPSAWDAVLAMMEYRSFLNVSNDSESRLMGSAHPVGNLYAGDSIPGEGVPRMSVEGLASRSDGAIFDRIGVDQNLNQPAANRTLFVDGGSLVLDNMHLKNVAFTDVHVAYHGGAVILESVRFVNCRFTMPNQGNSKYLALAVLNASPAVTFNVS